MSQLTELVAQAQSSDDNLKRDAFNELVRRFRGMAYKKAYATLNDPHMAEDAVQDAFIIAYTRINQLRDERGFPAWLRRIVLTQCDRLIRGKRPVLEPLEARFDLAETHPGPEEMVAEHEMLEHIHRAIDALPEHERMVTEGFYMQGESQKELAERLQIPLTTVKKRLQYAREHLRGIMLAIIGLNEALDQAFVDMMNPPQPQRQPIYLYSPMSQPQTQSQDIEDDE